MSRPTRESIHMATAYLWAQRSTCSLPGRKIGAVITTEDMRRVLSVGYNGPARGLPDDYCQGVRGMPPGPSSCDSRVVDQLVGSRCTCIHAETNAIAFVDSTIPNKVLFVTMEPCEQCAQLILQSNISRVLFWEKYRNTRGVELLASVGVGVEVVAPFVRTLHE